MRILFCLIVIIGCTKDLDSMYSKPKFDLENYKCKSEDLDKIDKMFSICNKTQFTGQYCYISALKSFCEYKGVKE